MRRLSVTNLLWPLLLVCIACLPPAGAAGTADSDHDGMPDKWEVRYGLDPGDPGDAGVDPDSDQLTNLAEFRAGTNPRLRDTDGDGLSDGTELLNTRTDPRSRDTNGDGRPDGATLYVHSDAPLFPHFSRGVTDYVNRCDPAAGVRIWISAPGGTRVSVDGGRPRSGAFRPRRPLSPGQQVPFTVESGGKSRTYHLRCLPAGFPPWRFKRRAKPSDAFYILTPGPWVAVWDAHGVPIWWMPTKDPAFAQDGKLLSGGRIGWFAPTSSYIGPPFFEIHRLDGTLAAKVGARSDPPSTDEHELQRLPNGDYLLDTYKRRPGTVDMSSCGGPKNAVVFDDEIQRIRPGRRAPVWTWDSKDHITLSETGRWCRIVNIIPLPEGGMGYDLIHLNSLQLVHGAVLFSTRHTDAIYKIDYATGRIIWKLGGTRTAKSLAIKDDPYGGTDFGGNHFARQLPDGTVTLHDNGTLRDRQARALRFRIDERARTATLIEQFTDPIKGMSYCCGSAERRPDGGWLISWGSHPLIEELSPHGALRFSITLTRPGWYSYRVFPVPHGRLSRRALRAGMDAMYPRG